ncbi:hypothetical protein HPB50_029237 [Hyalomma asiaticum]|nr:hypothetical protein HPB50_029237 [Hyalomma asiaticum]
MRPLCRCHPTARRSQLHFGHRRKKKFGDVRKIEEWTHGALWIGAPYALTVQVPAIYPAIVGIETPHFDPFGHAEKENVKKAEILDAQLLEGDRDSQVVPGKKKGAHHDKGILPHPTHAAAKALVSEKKTRQDGVLHDHKGIKVKSE